MVNIHPNRSISQTACSAAFLPLLLGAAAVAQNNPLGQLSPSELDRSVALLGPALAQPLQVPGVVGDLAVRGLSAIPYRDLEAFAAHYEAWVATMPGMVGFPVHMQWVHRPDPSQQLVLTETMLLGGESEPDSSVSGIDGGCDERRVRTSTTSFPWRTIAYTNHRHTGGGWRRCSGVILSRYMVLTAAHCIYDRGGSNYYDEFRVYPGRDDSSQPYGRFDLTRKRTNSAYINAGSSTRLNFDYGATFSNDRYPFGSTMAVRFDYSTSNGNILNMSGYPSSDPDGNSTRRQWWDSDPITSSTSRKVYYDIRSVGGASGAPVWRYVSSSRTRQVVAINVAHSTSCNGIGTRLVSNNRSLITSWINWTPGSDGLTHAGLPRHVPASHMLSARELNLVAVPVAVQPHLSVDRGMVQMIQDTVYSWDEFDIPMPNGQVRLAIKLLQPFERFLTVEEARLLLSASNAVHLEDPVENWQQEPFLPNELPAIDPPGSPVATGSIPTIDVEHAEHIRDR